MPLTSGYESAKSTSEVKQTISIEKNNFMSKRRHSFLGKENILPLELGVEGERLHESGGLASLCTSPLPMDVINSSIKQTPKPMEMSYSVSTYYSTGTDPGNGSRGCAP